MTRSNKKAGPPTRKQPVRRRSRKPAQRSTTPGTLLRKSSLRSTPPPPRDFALSDSEPPLDERPTPVPAPHLAALSEPPPDERPTPVMPEARTNSLLTERPVAFPIASEPKSRPAPVADSPSREVPEKEKGSNSWLLAAASVVLVGVGWAAFGNSGAKSSNSDVSSGNADMKTAPAPLPAAAPQPEPTPAAAAAAEVPAEPEQVIDLDAPEAPRAPRAPEAPNLAAPRVMSAKPAPKPAVQKPLEPAGAFNAGAADSALATAAARASSCRQDGDPTGVARVVVTFAPSGRVTSATISGPPFAGTQTGSCIAKTMRGMSVPAFTGDRMTISKTVVIM